MRAEAMLLGSDFVPVVIKVKRNHLKLKEVNGDG